VLALSLLVAGPARADGDPASDFLLTRSVFEPIDLSTPDAYSQQLAKVVEAAKQKGYPLRVALIGTRYDLGSVPVLYLKPAEYARFLGQELHFIYKGRLLVVMPNGYGVSLNGKAQPAAQKIVDALPAPGTGGVPLNQAAMRAIVKLAAAQGVTVDVPKLEGSKGTSANHDRVVLAGGAVGLLLLAAALVFVWRRFRKTGVV
jgi:hypothetical protein